MRPIDPHVNRAVTQRAERADRSRLAEQGVNPCPNSAAPESADQAGGAQQRRDAGRSTNAAPG